MNSRRRIASPREPSGVCRLSLTGTRLEQELATGEMLFGVSLHGSNPEPLTSALGLGRVETTAILGFGGFFRRAIYNGYYALIAAISGWMPMMFITRVRL